MEKLQLVLRGVAIILLLMLAMHFSNNLYESFREIQDIREKREAIKIDVADELKSIYNTEDVSVLDTLKNNIEYVRYEVLVEDKIKQAIYIKDTSEVVVLKQSILDE